MADEQPTLWEVRRTLERNHHETSADIADLKAQNARDLTTIVERLERYVLQAVYEADKRAAEISHQATLERIARVEAQNESQHKEMASQRDEMAGHHRMNRLLFWTVGGGILASIVTVVLTVLLTRGGVK